MIVVTGGLGFIGFNLIKKLNSNNITNIVIVDDLQNKHNNHKNIKKIKFLKIIDYRTSVSKLENIKKKIICIFHNGANSDTTCWDSKDIIEKNYTYSKTLFKFAIKKKIDFIYASSASVYGNDKHYAEDPLNLYACSKLLFDNFIKNFIKLKKKISIKIVGLRYFNVYGPYEDHKHNMSSPILTFFNQAKKNKEIKLFDSTNQIKFDKYSRDFIYVNDVVNINYKFFLLKKKVNGIFDIGSAKSTSFHIIATEIKKSFLIKKKFNIKLTRVKFPSKLKNFYQFYTKSNNKNFSKIFKNYKFVKINDGINDYLHYLNI
tara:strand:- start:4752 stop:5702 length:951 start_codon:yes stop_codon:yes gene_type:complete